MSSEFEDSGYIIHSRTFKERSLLLELFTVNHGRVGAVANFGKKDLYGLKAALQPFVPLRFVLLKGRSELLTLKDAKRCGKLIQLKVPMLFCAEYLNELLYYLYRDEDGSPKLLAAYMRTLKTLESSQNSAEVEHSLRDFELNLLENLGYAPDFRSPSGKWDPGAFYVYSVEDGFISGTDDTDGLISGAVLNEFAENKTFSPAALRMLKFINGRLLSQLLGDRKLKSRELYSDFIRQTA